jgi:hypothetical protein
VSRAYTAGGGRPEGAAALTSRLEALTTAVQRGGETRRGGGRYGSVRDMIFIVLHRASPSTITHYSGTYIFVMYIHTCSPHVLARQCGGGGSGGPDEPCPYSMPSHVLPCPRFERCGAELMIIARAVVRVAVRWVRWVARWAGGRTCHCVVNPPPLCDCVCDEWMYVLGHATGAERGRRPRAGAALPLAV